MNKDEWKFVLIAIFCWRIVLQIVLVMSPLFFELQTGYLGGGLNNYSQNPGFWAWANFDGEHYLQISKNGYLPLTHFFFPVYPTLGSLLSKLLFFLNNNQMWTLLLISHISFFLGIVGFYKLCKEELNSNAARLATLSLLFFPTSFYFAAAYTESLYFALAVWFFYLVRHKRWILAGLTGGILSAVRIVGSSVIPALAGHAYENFKSRRLNIQILIATILCPLGLLIYMYYLKLTTGDPLIFFNKIGVFGEQRSASIVPLPQVYYRYIFKILPNLNYSYFPVVFTSFLEIGIATLFLLLIIYSFKKIKSDLLIYSVIAYIIPTFAGSFSSMPRYVLALFPIFFLIGLILAKLSSRMKIAYFVISFGLLIISSSLFFNGFWLS